MKKMLSLVLALMLLMLCPAMAETAVEMQTMTSPDGTYSFEVPQDYFTLDASVLKTIFTTEEMQQFLANAMGLQDASQLAMYFEMMDANNMMIVYNTGMVSNLNVQAIATTLTMDMVVNLKDTLDSTTTKQYVALGLSEEDIQLMDIQEIGGRSWYGIQMVMVGMTVQTMMTVENGIQYVLGFTGMDADVIEHVLESFTVTAAVAE